MVPAPYIKLLRWKLSICDEQFFKRHNVESVYLDGEMCYVRGSERTPINPAIELVSDMEITKETFEFRAMTKIVMESSPPFTKTQLCTAYTCKLLTHHLSHHPVHSKSNLRIQSFTDLPQDIHTQFLHLCQLAYEGILSGYRGTRSLLPEHTEGLGLTVDFEGSVYFIHRTLQEYLAAVYISITIREGISDYFEEFLNLPYFGYLPYFIAGLTKLRFMNCQMLLKIRQRISKYLLMFESEFPHDLTKRTMSNLTEFTDTTIINNVMLILKGVELSTSSDIRSASTWSDLSMYLGLWHSNVGSWSASTRFDLSMDSRPVITRSALHPEYSVSWNYSHYITGRLLPLSDHCWKLTSMNEFMNKGFVEAIESVCNYKGVEFPSQNFKLTIDSYNYRRLSYLPYSILNRIEAMTLYNSFEEEISELECISDKLINLHEVYLKCRLNIVTPFLSHLKTLKILNLKWNYIGDDGASEITKILSVNQSLEELNIKHNGITDRGASELAEGLQRNKTLKILNLGWNEIGDDGASEIAKTLLVNQSLEELNIKHNDITERGASELAEGLKENKTLKILNLAGNEIGDDGASEIAKTLLVNQSLEELNIEHNGITERGASALAEGLQGNKTLKILNLEWNKIGDDGASEIAKTLLVNQSLEELNIEGNGITDRGASALAEGLKENKTLKILNLAGNEIGDDGASEIAKTLLVNQSLEELNIKGNVITDRGASALAKGLQGNKTLKILNQPVK